MGSLLILIGGFIGAGSAAKKPFLLSWVFLVNLCFSVYIGLFAAPLLFPMLEIPGLDAGYKIVFAVYGMLFVSMIVLYKTVDSIFPNREVALNLPLLAEKIGTLVVGFLAGSLVVTLVLYAYCMCPFSALIESPAREPLKIASGKSLLRMVRTVNILSLQSVSTEGERYLQVLGVMPPPPPPPARPPKKGKNTPANGSAVPAAGTQTAPAGAVHGNLPAEATVPPNVSPPVPDKGKATSGEGSAGRLTSIPDAVPKKPNPVETDARKTSPGLGGTLRQRNQSQKSMLENDSAIPATAVAPPESRKPESPAVPDASRPEGNSSRKAD